MPVPVAKPPGLSVRSNVRSLQDHPARAYNTWLTDNYRARPYLGRLICIHNESQSEQEMARWRAYTGKNLEVHVIPGRHGNIMEPPHVGSIAQIVRRALAEHC